jgi:adenylate kinase
MSKKYFINKVDSLLGEVLLQELVKGEEEGGETSIMGSFVDAKREDPPLKGMKKILKRYKPKLFRKKLLEECDTMIYSIEDVDDIRFGIECLKW